MPDLEGLLLRHVHRLEVHVMPESSHVEPNCRGRLVLGSREGYCSRVRAAWMSLVLLMAALKLDCASVDPGARDDAGVSDATLEMEAAAKCPYGKQQGISGAPCMGCLGEACAPEHYCAVGYHSGGPASTECRCMSGYMACCHFTDATISCDYAGHKAPGCPRAVPIDGEPCTGSFACRYDQPDRGPYCREVAAYCSRDGVWSAWRSLGCQNR